jgi:poly(3-hydroxybutyrate) depolymerase
MRILATIAFALLTATPASGFAAARSLPALGADATRVSVSGLSSGGFMAVQYSVAYSGSVMGAGIVAGGPYNCAPPNGALFIQACMRGEPPAERSWAAAKDFARWTVIDPVANLRRQRIYLFSGQDDSVVLPSVMRAVRGFYGEAGVPDANVAFVQDMPAGHAFVSAGEGASCGTNGGQYIVRCPIAGGGFYDQPGAILTHIYGPLAAPAAMLSTAPFAFDQGEFAEGAARMAAKGYAYVPAACAPAAAGCAVHVVFHGCQQSADTLGSNAVYARLGYNRWAESNRIVILYPQVDASLANPMGCWDWWGYSGLNFQLRGGPQMAAVRKMIVRVTGQP